MDKFILVSLDSDKKVLKESVDMHALVSKSFGYKSDISSVCESMDVLSGNGYRVIVEAETPFMHSEEMVLNEGLKELYNKFKEKFGGTKDEFEDWYQERMAEKREAGTDTSTVAREPRALGGHKVTGPAPIKGVGTGHSVDTRSKRLRTPVAPKESEEEIKARQDKVAKARKMIPATKAYIKKMFANDKESFVTLMNELTDLFEREWKQPLEDVAKF